jgi:hypothetical protein
LNVLGNTIATAGCADAAGVLDPDPDSNPLLRVVGRVPPTTPPGPTCPHNAPALNTAAAATKTKARFHMGEPFPKNE